MSELDRLRELKDIDGVHGPGWREFYEPGTFGCHEALFVTDKASDFITLNLLHHPAIVLNQEWYSLADQAVKFLNMLYKKIDQVHVTGEIRGSDEVPR